MPHILDRDVLRERYDADGYVIVRGLYPFQHIGILSLEFHVDKLSRPLL